MKDPIQTHLEHGQRLEEIFGKIKQALFGKKQSTTPSSFLDAMERYRSTDATDKNCKGLGGANRNVGGKLNKVASGSGGGSEVKIGINTIKNIKGLRFELIDKKKRGTGKFNNAIVDDFRCYDLINDPYGIAWLFDKGVEYVAEYVSGDLKYLGKNTSHRNQRVNFVGNWTKGTFHGVFVDGSWGGEARMGQGAKFLKGNARRTGQRQNLQRQPNQRQNPQRQANRTQRAPAGNQTRPTTNAPQQTTSSTSGQQYQYTYNAPTQGRNP